MTSVLIPELSVEQRSASLAETYHFADFTRGNYRKLLRLAKQSYVFRSYANAHTDADDDQYSVLWRHDVDYSVHSARALAQIEHEEGIHATYFFRLHSELYNLLEHPVTELARAIVRLGHDIGLHLDTACYDITSADALHDIVAWESSILERVVERPVSAFSFHQPTPFLLGCQRETYGGRINTYAARFQDEVGYVSDSNGYWRHRRLETVLRDATDRHLQVLTHPVWWTDDVMSPAARIERCIGGRAESMRRYYREDMHHAGRTNVGA